MKNLNELKKIYNIIEILEQEKIIDDKLNIEKIDFLQSFDGVYTHKIVFYYSTNSCEEIYTVSIKMLNGMNFTALIEGKYKYSSTEIEVQKNITFMNSGLDENLFILNTNNNLVSIAPVFCYYYGSLEDGFKKISNKEITTSINHDDVKKLELKKNDI